MPNPTLSDVHVSAPLTNLTIAYSNEDSQSVHDKVFPIIPVTKQADKYYTYDKQDWLRTDAKRRAPGAEVAISGWRLSTDNYFCERYALGVDIDDPTRANADPAVSDLDGDGVRFVTEDLRLRREKDWVTDFFATSKWTGASSTSDMTGQAAPATTSANFLQWNDAGSTPIEDIRGEQTAVQKRIARRPNTLVLGTEVWTALADHPDIIERIKYTEIGVVTTDLIASLLDLDNVYVSGMVEDTAKEGAAASIGFQAGKHALLCYVNPKPGLRALSAGYTFSWTGMPGAPAGGIGARIKRYRLERNESDRIEGEDWKDFKIVDAKAGAFFASAVA